MHIARVSVIISCFSLAACTGRITTTPLAPSALKNTKTPLSGIVAFLPKPVIEVTELTQYSPDGGKTFAPTCTPRWMYTLTTIADHAHPILIQYHPGTFEQHKFSATFATDGEISSINSQGTPDQGKTLQNVLGAVAGLPLKAFAAAVEGPKIPPAHPQGQPACNTGNSFYEYVPAKEGTRYRTDLPPS